MGKGNVWERDGRWHVDIFIPTARESVLDRLASSYNTLPRIVAQKCLRVALTSSSLQTKLVQFVPESEERWVQLWLKPETFRETETLGVSLLLSVPDLCARAACIVPQESDAELRRLMQEFIESEEHN